MSESNETTFIPLTISDITSTNKSEEKVYVFDIDETLYLCNDNIKKLRRKHSIEFLMSKGFTEEEAISELERYTSVYGLEIRGLIKEMKVEGDLLKYLAYPYPGSTDLISQDYELIKLLNQLKGRKICLTNGNAEHAKQILSRLGVINQFECIFHCDYEIDNFIAKPDKEVFLAVQNYLGVKPELITFFDDLDVHINSAKSIGWNAYKVENGVTVSEILKKIINN